MKHFLVIALVCLAGPAADGQARRDEPLRDDDGDGDYLRAGRWEFTLSALGSSSEQDGTDVEVRTIGADTSLSVFLTEWLEIGAKAEYANRKVEFEDTDTESETDTLLGGGQLLINIPTGSRFVPFGYGGGGVAYSNFEVNDEEVSEDVGAFWEAGGGLRIFVTPSVALIFRVVFQQILQDDEGDIDSIVGTAGISLLFG